MKKCHITLMVTVAAALGFLFIATKWKIGDSFSQASKSLTADYDLGQLFRHYGTDKDINGYTSIYHTLFHHLKDKPIVMLEIGIGTMRKDAHSSMVGYAGTKYQPGGSLRAWRDYFTYGTIYGADIQEDTQFIDEPRISTYLCDSVDKSQTENFERKLDGLKFDIIIDDGSHIDANQLKTLANFYPLVKDGGFYIIEDIYPGSGLTVNPNDFATLCNGDPYFFVGLKNNICVIYKNHLKRDTQTYAY